MAVWTQDEKIGVSSAHVCVCQTKASGELARRRARGTRRGLPRHPGLVPAPGAAPAANGNLMTRPASGYASYP